MKKQLLAFVVLATILCAVQVQDANAVKKAPAINTTATQGAYFNLTQMPVLVFVGTLIDPFNSLYTYKLYGSGGIITSAYEYYGTTSMGAVSISGGLYRAETGHQIGWYIDQGTLTSTTDTFNFFEALYVDLT